MRSELVLGVMALMALSCSGDGTTAPTAGGGSSAQGGGASGGTGAGGVTSGGTGASSGTAGTPSAGSAAGGAAATEGGAGGAPDALPGATLFDLYCPPAVAPYPDPLAGAPEPSVVAIAPPGGISFLEGPVWLAEPGVLLLSEWNQGHRILQLTPPQTVEVFLPASRTNGLALSPESDALWVVREAPGAAISRLQLSNKQIDPVVEDYQGEAFVQPNDLALQANGTLFFTDYQAGRLYRRSTDGEVTLISSLAQSNGVGVSPDEKSLYLNTDSRTVRYPLAADGSVGAGSDFVTGLSGGDGLALDCAGNLYLAENAGGALTVASASGEPLGAFDNLPQTVTNAAFGGPERKTLYITTSSALYQVELPIPGLPY